MNQRHPRYPEVLTDRLGLKLAARLNAGTADLPHDITERLRAARERALAQRKAEVRQHVPVLVPQGQGAALSWGGDEGLNLWGRLSAALALGVLVLGLLGINDVVSSERAQELAAVDVALLTDELPPAAFADPGFIQFLKTDM